MFSYILEAVHLVATDGWRLLPLYRFEPDSGLWRHRDAAADPPLSLADVTYADGTMAYEHPPHIELAATYEHYLDEARAALARAADRTPLAPPEVTGDFEHLRWFPFPDEIGAPPR